MDQQTLSTVITLLFGAGAGGAVSGFITLIKTWRQGRTDNEETLINRLDKDNKRQNELREAAEGKVERAELIAQEYRRQRDEARDDVARLRRILIINNPELIPEDLKNER